MPSEIVMPRLGWTMEVGTVVEWLKASGDPVEAGDHIFAVESDKAITEVESLDSGAAAMVVRELLEDEGYHTLAATTAAEALAIVEARGSDPLDLVLTDISLPDMLGTRLAERIRERLPATPVIFMSGYDRSDVALGPSDAYLTKPFDFDDLLGTVRATLQRTRVGRLQ